MNFKRETLPAFVKNQNLPELRQGRFWLRRRDPHHMFSLRLGHLAVLTVHRTVIHCHSAVHKTLCVLLTTSELFALRAHNPAPTWLQPTLQAKRKATRMGCFSFWLRRWDLNHMTSGSGYLLCDGRTRRITQYSAKGGMDPDGTRCRFPKTILCFLHTISFASSLPRARFL